MEVSLMFEEVRRAGLGEGHSARPPHCAITGGNAVTDERGVFNICTIPYGNIATTDIGSHMVLRQV
jgi:hypothetical protein